MSKLRNDLIRTAQVIESALKDAGKPEKDFRSSVKTTPLNDALLRALQDIVSDCEADYPPSHGAIKQAAKQAIAAWNTRTNSSYAANSNGVTNTQESSAAQSLTDEQIDAENPIDDATVYEIAAFRKGYRRALLANTAQGKTDDEEYARFKQWQLAAKKG